jgi:hypothetical protein
VTGLASPTNLFGVPLVIDHDVAVAIRRALASAWVAAFDEEPASVSSDLARLRGFFDPITTGQRLRKTLEAVPGPCVARPIFSDLLLMDVGDDKCIPTPEGRVVLEVLTKRLDESSTGSVVLPTSDVSAAEHTLVDLYRSWTRSKLLKAVSLQQGTASPLLPTSIGVGLWLVINGNVGAAKSIKRPRDPDSRRHLDAAVAGPVMAFADTIQPGRRQSEHLSLYSGYALTELRRRLSGSLSPTIQDLYIRDGEEHTVVDFLAADLARRPNTDVSLVAEAFDRLVTTFRQYLPRLAALGLAHERPSATASSRSLLLEAYAIHRGDG